MIKGNQSVADGDSSRDNVTIINCVVNVPLILTCIVGNTLVLAAIMRTPSLRSAASMILLCSLAASDLLVGLVVQPVFIASQLTGDYLNLARNTMALAACGVSLFAITAIAVDRFLALHFHMRYPSLMTTRCAVYLSTAIWLFCIILLLLCVWFTNIFFRISMAVVIFICLIVSAVCHISIYRIVRQHQLQITAQRQAVERFTENAENNQNMHTSKKNAMSTFIYFMVMVLCYSPSFTAFLILNYFRDDYWTKPWMLAFTISFMNSSLNPFLYCWRQREIRTAVVKTARQMLCKETQET